PRWYWQRGGWLLMDRVTGRVAPINLPDFEPLYSAASWYRDYIAYCGVSDDGRKLYAIVAQLGRRKPVLKNQSETRRLMARPILNVQRPPGSDSLRASLSGRNKDQD